MQLLSSVEHTKDQKITDSKRIPFIYFRKFVVFASQDIIGKVKLFMNNSLFYILSHHDYRSYFLLNDLLPPHDFITLSTVCKTLRTCLNMMDSPVYPVEVHHLISNTSQG